MRAFKISVGSIAISVAITAICAVPAASHGQIFVANYGSVFTTPGAIGEYGMDGTTINASLIIPAYEGPFAVSGSGIFILSYGRIDQYSTSGTPISTPLISTPYLLNPAGIAISGSDLFALSEGPASEIFEYTTSGGIVNQPLVGNVGTNGLAISGSDLFVGEESYDNGPIVIFSEYTTAGATVNADLLTWSGGGDGYAFAASGPDLFIADSSSGTVDEYTTSGVPVSVPLISGLTDPTSIAVDGSDLYVTNSAASGWVGEYTTSGATINADLISGLDEPVEIAIADVPEPASLSLLLLGGVSLLNRRRRMPQISR